MQAKKSSQKILKSTSNAMFLFFIFLSTLLILNSCSEKPQVPAPVQPQTQEVSTKNDVQKQIKKTEDDKKITPFQEIYTYNPSGKVDPFVPMISEKIGGDAPIKNTASKKPEQEVPLTPLQKLNADDFTLVAVISTPKGLCALLEDPAMNGFIIKEGMQIGKKAGVIKKIFYNSVLIEEKTDETQENSEKKIMTLTLRKK
jgi:Tfp pilus assembly protein PilP